MKKVCVIGAGASGLMAAIFAAKEGGRVTLFEGNPEVGKKILRTGNGRCNLTNENLSPDKYISDDISFVEKALSKFNKDELLTFMAKIGLLTKENEGYYYPYTEQASAVRNVLLAECLSYGINIKTNTYINMIAKNDENAFLLSIEGQKERESFDSVIISTGTEAGLTSKERTNGIKLLKPFDLDYADIKPGLVKLKCNGLDFQALKGVRCDCELALEINDEEVASEKGELLFWENGISGICVFNISNYCANALADGDRIIVNMDLLPHFSEKELIDSVKTMYMLNQDKPLITFLSGIVNEKLAAMFVDLNEFDRNSEVNTMDLELLEDFIHNMKNLSVEVTDVAGINNAQVCVGGILTSELTEKFEVKKVPGLFITGEIINVTGKCGGYNLQWAFTSGAIAGEASCC